MPSALGKLWQSIADTMNTQCSQKYKIIFFKNVAIWGHSSKPRMVLTLLRMQMWLFKIFYWKLVQFSCSVTFSSLWPHEPQYARLLCPSPTPGACWNSCPLSQSCHPTISSSVISSSSSCLLSLPVSGSFPVNWLFPSDGQSIGASASAPVLSMNIHHWFPLGLAGLTSLQSKELSIVFTNTTVRKHQFFGAQPSLWSNSHIHVWLLEKTIA